MPVIVRKLGWLFPLLFCITAFIGACTGQGGSNIKHDTAHILVWPEAPNKPRIKFIGTVSQPEDIGITKGFFGMLSELALGKEENRLVLPMDVVENHMKQLYVADPGVKAVHRFDRKKGLYQTIKWTGGKDFKSPVSLAADSEGKVYIADSELGRIFVVGNDDSEAVPLELEEDFIRPTGIAVDKQSGWIYVVDTGLHSISIFNPDMSLLKRFGHRGTGEGEFNFPTYIWHTRNRELLVTDSLNFRIQRFDRHGNYLGQFGKPGDTTGSLPRPKGVAEDRHGHIYVVDSLFHNVQIFDDSGSTLMHFGKQGDRSGEFWLPVGIFISDDDSIYLCDSYNQRVQVFEFIGKEL